VTGPAGMNGGRPGARIVSLPPAPLFKGLGQNELAELAASAREWRVSQKQPLFNEGEPTRELSLLSAGRAKITQLSAGGDVVILRLAVTGEVVGGLGLTPGAPHPATPVALEPCDILSWEMRAFGALAERFPALHLNALRILAERVRDIEERYLELATETVAPRLARTLLRLLGQVGRPYGGGALISLSREELAQMTGTTLFTVSRLLSQWEARGFLKAGRESVIVGDPRGLVGVAEEAGRDDNTAAWASGRDRIRIRP
jgi:CRP/FNR family transcriptional regulator, nitrogen oxide reductase regulator